MPESTAADSLVEPVPTPVSTPAENSSSLPSTESSPPTAPQPIAETKDAEGRTESLYAKVRANLEKFRDAAEKDDENETEADASADEAAPADTNPDPSNEPETPASEDQSESKEPAKQPEAAAADVAPAAPTLPAAHIRSLKAFGLTDEEIKTTSPQVAAALHARRNQEITRWAEAGRQQKAQTQSAVPVPPPALAAPSAAAPVDIAALRQQYGDEPLIAHLEAQQRAAAQQAEELKAIKAHYDRAVADTEQRKLEALGQQINLFFSSKDLEAYRETYGDQPHTLTTEQLAKREEVLKLADAIIGGARVEGTHLNLQQALQHAFDSVSAPIQKQIARQEIKKQVQQRAKGISLKPGGRPAVPKAAATREEREKATRANLRKVFG